MKFPIWYFGIVLARLLKAKAGLDLFIRAIMFVIHSGIHTVSYIMIPVSLPLPGPHLVHENLNRNIEEMGAGFTWV